MAKSTMRVRVGVRRIQSYYAYGRVRPSLTPCVHFDNDPYEGALHLGDTDNYGCGLGGEKVEERAV